MIAAAALLAGCAKESGDGVDATLSFSTDTPELLEVKAAAATSVNDFYTIGYNGDDTQWFPNSGGPQNVTLPGSATFDTYKWKMRETKTFFAYSNNLPASGATATIANTDVTLTYTAMPADAANQPDVTLGRYSGNGGGSGTAAITFYHPLAQVVFKMGDMVGVSKIDKIEISGVYNAGTTTLSTSTTVSDNIADFSWTGISGSATVSQTITGSLPSKDSEFGTPFMLIPQSLATQNVTVSVTVTTTGGSSATLTKTLTSGAFATGKKTVCTLTVDPARELGCTLASYLADADDDIFKTMPVGALRGKFTINADGDQVYFSKGNLQFRATADGSGSDLSHKTADGTKQGIWRFAEEQWHTVGDGGTNLGNVYETIGGESHLCDNTIGFSTMNEETRMKYTGWVDIFPDSSSGYQVNPWDLDGSMAYYGPGPYFRMNNLKAGCDATAGTVWEWGYYNAISNGGDVPGIWRTPVYGELDYLLITRQKTNLTIGTKRLTAKSPWKIC